MQEALWDFEPEGGGRRAPRRPAEESGGHGGEGDGNGGSERDGGARGRRGEPGPRGYLRRGLDRCPRCGQPVEVFQLALGEDYDAVVPGEYPSARVPEDAARHLVRGRLWRGRDSGGWSRVWHRAVCPEEAMPEHPELLAMWRVLRVRRRAQAEAKEQ